VTVIGVGCACASIDKANISAMTIGATPIADLILP
jgi:hypothetical protein